MFKCSEIRKGIRNDEGRDYYDFVEYIERGIKPDYDYLKDKLINSRYIRDANIIVDNNWTKEQLFKRINGLDDDTILEMNDIIESITKSEYKRVIDKEMLKEAIKKLG